MVVDLGIQPAIAAVTAPPSPLESPLPTPLESLASAVGISSAAATGIFSVAVGDLAPPSPWVLSAPPPPRAPPPFSVVAVQRPDSMIPNVGAVPDTGSNTKGENLPVHVTSIRLNKDNYLSWSAALEIGITSRGPLHYITGEKPAPAKNDPKWSTWTLEDGQVKVWIISSVSADIQPLILRKSTAYEMWTILACMYGQLDYHTNDDWKDASDHALYWEKEWMDRTFIFLGGLRDEYESIRSQLLNCDEIPGIEEEARNNKMQGVQKHGFDLGAFVGDLTLEDDGDSDEISLEGLQQVLEECKNDDVVANILAKGTKLREYTKGVENNIRTVELESIQDYIRESDNLVVLHEQIRDCDLIISQMETLLGGFQAEIGSISSEIKTLQEKSMDMGLKLKNRKVAELKLSGFVEEIIVPPKMVDIIVDGEVVS
ncbi:Vacuolar sorting-associated protein 52 A [Nymphaea thermarum]|nr:Vacuolar sorting-associated protein 52 A [Nymphaea thermarum]